MDTVKCGFCQRDYTPTGMIYASKDFTTFCSSDCRDRNTYFHPACDVGTWNKTALKNLETIQQERKAAKQMRAQEEEAPLYCVEPQGQPVDNVNSPKHYTEHPSKVECITITEHMNFCLGNAIKYIWRADLKGGSEDLEKAIWYLEREISRREKK